MSIRAGTINEGSSLMSISAPRETINNAPNMSRTGIVIILAIVWTLDSATSIPAKKAPVATDIPIRSAINASPNATLKTVIKIKSY